MGRKTEIVLDGDTYHVPTLSIDQLERIGDASEAGAKSGNAAAQRKAGFEMFKIMVEDIEPTAERVRCTPVEMEAAMQAIMRDAGMVPPMPAAAPATPAETPAAAPSTGEPSGLKSSAA